MWIDSIHNLPFMLENLTQCQQMKKISTSVCGGKKGTLVESSKILKRDYTLISPSSPEGTVSLANIRSLFKEELVPINNEFDHLQKSVEFTSEQMKDLVLLNEKIVKLEKRQ